MKLFAKTTSERASKGQGGSQFLKVEITADKKSVAEISVHEQEGEWIIKVWDRDRNALHLFCMPTEDTIQKQMLKDSKGKKQEEPLIPYCNICGSSVYINKFQECTKCHSTDIGYMDNPKMKPDNPYNIVTHIDGKPIKGKKKKDESKCIECDCIVPDSETGYCYNCCEKIKHTCR